MEIVIQHRSGKDKLAKVIHIDDKAALSHYKHLEVAYASELLIAINSSNIDPKNIIQVVRD